MEEQSISQKIIKNTIFNAVGRFWGILVALILTPYIIRHIGIERYGIWALVGVLTGYFGLLDFGIGTSFVKYISEFYAKKDFEKINQVINTGFVFYSIFAIFLITLSFFVINPLLTFFKIPSHLYNESVFVFFLGIILFSVSNALSPFGAIQGGLQRMDISNKVAIAVSIPNIAGTIFFLEKGYSLPGLMVNNGIVLLISSVASLVIAFRILPELRFNPLVSTKAMLKKLFGFGAKVQITKIASLLHSHLDEILLAYFLNIGFVAYYAVAQGLTSKISEMPLMLISAIMPAASELDARSEKGKLQELYFRSMKYLILAGTPIFIMGFTFAHSFIQAWLGAGYERTAFTLQLLLVAGFINLLTGPGFYIFNGMGKPQYGMYISVLSTIMKLTLSITLIIKFGYYGTVLGTCISFIICSVIFLAIFHKITEISLIQSMKKFLFLPILVGLVSLFIPLLIFHQIGNPSLVFICLTGTLYMCVYGWLIWKSGYISVSDMELWRKLLPTIIKYKEI
ncbi:MAG: flippase [Proteobacteria bacterium]|nr:flippase [Pseudomonadota bacterium]